MEVSRKTCKKCKRELPLGYEYKLCESCRNKRIDTVKKVGGAILSLGLTAIGIKTGRKSK